MRSRVVTRFLYNPLLQVAQLVIPLTQRRQQPLVETRKAVFDLFGNLSRISKTEMTCKGCQQQDADGGTKEYFRDEVPIELPRVRLQLQQPSHAGAKQCDHRQRAPKANASHAACHRSNSIQKCVVHRYSIRLRTHCVFRTRIHASRFIEPWLRVPFTLRRSACLQSDCITRSATTPNRPQYRFCAQEYESRQQQPLPHPLSTLQLLVS